MTCALPPQLDHLVLTAPDPAAAAARFADLAGIDPVPGGDGTWFVGLDVPGADDRTCYLEIVGPGAGADDPDVPAAPGLSRWAIRADDLDATAASAAARGVDVGEVGTGRTTAPDGTVVTWRQAACSPRHGAVPPCLVAWQGHRHPGELPLPRVGLIALQVCAPDVDDVGRLMGALMVDVEVVRAPARGLRARLSGPAGDFELSTAGC